MRIDHPNLTLVGCLSRSGRRSAALVLCAVSAIVLPATARADDAVGLRHPSSTQFTPDGCTSGCPCSIGTTDNGGRPVLAGFQQPLPDASPAYSGADTLYVPNGTQQPMPYGDHNPEAGPGGRFSRLRGLGWGFGTGGAGRPRHQGIGRPLERESWLYRPFSASSFLGVMQGSPLIDDWTNQKSGYFAGYRLGWDFDYYWGCEIRYAFGSIPLADSQRAKDAAGPNSTDYRHDCDVVLADFDILYYPWGDSAWRPYFMFGVGAAGIRFEDRLGNVFDADVFAMPLAFGLKYRWTDWLILRFDFADNIIFGDGHGFNALHNLSVTGGVEFRFGGSRTAYWPWNSSRHYW